MAGDWIKMRVWLAKDPKVIAIADFLSGHRPFMDWLSDPVRQHCDKSAYEHVTRHVTVCVTVTGLLQLWGVTREDGHRDGDDLVVPMTDPTALDEIAGFPGLGAALEFVGWAVYHAEEHMTVFPKFFRRNASSDEMRRLKDAERQRRRRQNMTDTSRDSHADASRDSHAVVTHREEKRREEKSNKEPPTVPQGTIADEGERKRNGDAEAKQQPSYSMAFLQFWETYPPVRRQGKRAAWKAWQAAIKRKPPADILAAVAEFAKSELGKCEFCPGPAPWLNQDRWDDDRHSWERKTNGQPKAKAEDDDPYKNYPVR